jgi:phosphoserine phosphatase RsbU/P
MARPATLFGAYRPKTVKVKLMKLSLRLKLFVLLTMLPILALSLYIALAARLFEEDKIAYVYDSSTAITKSMSARVGSELNSFRYEVNPLIEGYSNEKENFDETTQSLFAKQEAISALFVFKANPDGTLKPAGSLTRPNVLTPELSTGVLEMITAMPAVKEFGAKSGQDGLFAPIDKGPGFFLLGLHYAQKNNAANVVAIALLPKSQFNEIFQAASAYSTLLIDEHGKRIAGTDPASAPIDAAISRIALKGIPEGSESIAPPGAEEMLISYSKVPIAGLTVMSMISKKTALRAVQILLTKSILFFVALISVTVILSLLASKRLTSALTALHEATRQIGEGNFEQVHVDVQAKDEIGDLANRFNQMAHEVSNLMKANMDRVRMEGELQTAKLVQETLFPAVYSDFGSLEVAGYYEPASECGGDWWYYNQIGDKYFFWIGDATGHGVPAALITSAARSAACMIERLGGVDLTPSRAMALLNRSIREVSRGKINMTFFLGCLDPQTGKFSYCNASHLPPYLIKSTGTIGQIQSDIGPILGYEEDPQFQTAEIDLYAGDSIIVFTDGVCDIVNPAGESFGRKRTRNAFHEAATTSGTSAQSILNHINVQTSSFRETGALVDDVTFFVIKIKDSVASDFTTVT